MTDYLGARHISSEVVGELQRKANFSVDIAGLPTTVTFLTKTFPLPAEASEVITVPHGNSEVKFAGKTTFEGGDMVLHDSITLDTEKTVANWRESVYKHDTEAIGLVKNYKKDATVTEYAPDGTLTRQWRLEGVWPSKYTPGDLDSSSTDIKDITITLVWDRGYRIK